MESKCITTLIQKSMVLNFNFRVRIVYKMSKGAEMSHLLVTAL